MNYEFTLFTYALLASAFMGILVATIAWRRGRARGGIYLSLLGLAVAEWAFAIGFESAATDLNTKIAWSQLGYLGTAGAPLLYFLFAMAYSQSRLALTRRTIALLALIPAITVALAFSNAWHGWLWPTITLDAETNIASYGHSVWWWIFLGYSYVLLAVGLIVLARSLSRFPAIFHPQRNILLAGSVAPIFGNLVYVFKLGPDPGLDWTPLGFALSAAILAYGIFRHRLLDVSPIARERLIEWMGDSVLVLDHERRIIDLNPAAQRLSGRELAQVAGQSLAKALPGWPDMPVFFENGDENRIEITLGEGEGKRYYDVHASALRNRNHARLGWLLVLRDMTEQRQREMALHAEKEKAQQYFDLAGTLVVAVDQDGNITLINQLGLDILGYEKEELIGQNWFETCLPKRNRKEVYTVFEHLMMTGTSGPLAYFENSVLTKDGRERLIAWHNDFMKNAEGEVIGSLSSGKDITEQAQAERALREVEQQYTYLFERVPVGLYRTTPEGRILDANPAFVDMLGYPDQETLLAANAADLFLTPDEREEEMSALDAADTVSDFELQIRRYDGEIIWTRDHFRAVRGDDGRVHWLEGSLEDITERVRAEEQLQKHVFALHERVKELNCLYDISKVAQKRGLSLKKILQKMVELIPGGWQNPENVCAQIVVEGIACRTENFAESPWRQASDIVIKGQALGAVEVFHRVEQQKAGEGPFPKEEGALIDAIAGQIGRIVEWKWAEEGLREHQEHLEELVAERTAQLQKRLNENARLNQSIGNILEDQLAANEQVVLTSQQLEEANQELEAFVYSISHDLRAPLRHIDNFAQLLFKREAGNLEPTSARYLQNVVIGADRMERLFDNLLTFSRAGRVEMNLRDVDSNKVVEQARVELAHLYEQRRITWEIATLPVVRADPSLLSVVWTNLLSNAIKYTGTRPEAHIEIGTIPAEAEGEVVFYVRDNGVGFDPQYKNKLFGVFQRLHGHDEFEGNGIGLATVRHIIQRMDGRTWGEGEIDSGATFYFTLMKSRSKQ